MKKIAALLLSIFLILSFILFKSYTNAPYNGISSITFDNTSDGEDKISMTERRTYTASFEYKDDIDVDKLTWLLQRDEGEFDPDMFPNQYLGGRLEDWKVAFGENLGEAIFRITETRLKDNKVTMTFCSDNTFFSTDSIYSWAGVRNYMMDYIGDYELICTDGEKEIASATIRINPYDSYRTEDELAVQLKEAAESINAKEGIYAQIFSMGSSSMGKDIPYMILADSRASVENYQDLTEKALEDPQEVMDMIQ